MAPQSIDRVRSLDIPIINRVFVKVRRVVGIVQEVVYSGRHVLQLRLPLELA